MSTLLGSLITKCIADRSSSRTSWCSPTGPRQNQKTFYVGYLLLSLFGLLHNLAFVSVQWLPRRFSWLSDSQVDPDRLSNRAIIGGNVSLVKTKRNQFHPTQGTPVGFGGATSPGPGRHVSASVDLLGCRRLRSTHHILLA